MITIITQGRSSTATHRSRGAWRSADREYANGAARRSRARHIISLNERTAVDRGSKGFTTRMLSVPRPPKLHRLHPRRTSSLLPRARYCYPSIHLSRSLHHSTTHRAQSLSPDCLASSQYPSSTAPAQQNNNTPCVPSHTYTATNTDTPNR